MNHQGHYWEVMEVCESLEQLGIFSERFVTFLGQKGGLKPVRSVYIFGSTDHVQIRTPRLTQCHNVCLCNIGSGPKDSQTSQYNLPTGPKDSQTSRHNLPTGPKDSQTSQHHIKIQ